MKRFKLPTPTWLRVKLVSTSAALRFVKRHSLSKSELRNEVTSTIVEIPSYMRANAESSDEIEVLSVEDTGETVSDDFFAEDFAADAEIEGSPS